MKISELTEPYKSLAEMRRGDRKDDLLACAFEWDDTPEWGAFWGKVRNGFTPEIPAASLAELEAWKNSKEVKDMPDLQPAEPDYKAMYEQLQSDYNILNSQYQIASMPTILPTTANKETDFVLRTAQMAMQGYLAMRATSSITPSYKEVASEAFDYAAAMLGEAKKRNLL